MLVRNLGGATFCAERQMPFVADMTLNAVNQWTVGWLHELGARRVAAAYDSDRCRLMELADAAPWANIEVVVHQYIPLFHTEHCLFDTEVGGRRAEVPDAPLLLTKSGVSPLATASAISYSVLPAPRSRPLTPDEQARQEQRRAAPCSFACMKHEVRLRDRMGVEHPLQSDACCRNTLYHAEPQSFFDHVAELKRHGVHHFRIELLDHVPHGLIRRALATK
jgi:putative protease